MPDTTLFRSPRSAAGHAFPARHRQRHDDSRVDDGGVEVPAAPHTAARTGAVCAYGHFRAEPFDLAGGSLDGRPGRLALGVLADTSASGHCRLVYRIGPAERPDPDKPLPAGPLRRPGLRRAGLSPDSLTQLGSASSRESVWPHVSVSVA